MLKKNSITGAVLAIAMVFSLFSPLAVGATTVSDDIYSNFNIDQLQSLIGKLQKRLDELKKGSLCYVADSELSLGDGEDGDMSQVRRLQDFLREKGFLKIKSTGYFGKLTRTALINFQKNNNLPTTGSFDSATKAKAHSLFCATLGKIKSEAVKVEKKIEEKASNNSSSVSSIATAVSGAQVKWVTNGYSKNGYKIVWSKNATPTYPTREGDQYIYLSDPSAQTTTIEAFAGAGEYHVRVCEYLGGACGVYSNEVVTQL